MAAAFFGASGVVDALMLDDEALALLGLAYRKFFVAELLSVANLLNSNGALQ
jgi:hypothetical protein